MRSDDGREARLGRIAAHYPEAAAEARRAGLDDDLALRAQNNAPSWRDCEAAGLRHRLGPVVEVVSLYGSPVLSPVSTIRRCQRCPVGIMTVGRPPTPLDYRESIGGASK